MRTLAPAIGLVAALVLSGCSDDPPRWGAVGDDTCASLGLAALVANAFPDEPAAEVSSESRTGGPAGEGGSDATCQARVASPGGDLTVVVELASSGTSGDTSLYGLRDEIDGGDAESEPVDGWWEKGVRVTAGGPPGSARVNLVVSDDNLVVAVRVYDRRGSDTVDPAADSALADAVVALVPGLVPHPSSVE